MTLCPVYEVIADHFSATRYRQWPVVERFLRGLPSGSLVTDVGCGNGKNMVDHWAEHTSAAATAMDAARTRTLAPGTTMVSRPQLFFSGSDRSSALAEICRQHRPNADVAVADTTCLPYRSRCFDVAISIAVIHHLATRARRLEAVRELLRVVRPGGQVLLYVWALEQRQMPGNRLKTVELPNCERTSDYDAEQVRVLCVLRGIIYFRCEYVHFPRRMCLSLGI